MHYILFAGSREQAFAYALAAASLTQAVSKACSAGITVRCSCGSLPRDQGEIVATASPVSDGTAAAADSDEKFQWGGCSDDVKFGLEFSETFVEAASPGGGGKRKSSSKSKGKASKRDLMNRHNYLVGRKVRSEDYL